MTISDGDWTALFASPLSIALWTISIVGFVLPIVFGKAIKRRMAMKRDLAGDTTVD
jgi:putative tricarboxylic transport membrane protein